VDGKCFVGKGELAGTSRKKKEGVSGGSTSITQEKGSIVGERRTSRRGRKSRFLSKSEWGAVKGRKKGSYQERVGGKEEMEGQTSLR